MAMADEVLIERMSWTQVREAMAQGKRTVILPLAAMEQHGPHMAIGTDTYLGYANAERLARALGDALVAPAVSIGYSVGHLPMPGTVTIAEETLTTVVKEVADSLVHHGFEDVVLLVSHGGNYGALRAAVPELRQKHPNVRFHAQMSFDDAMGGRDALYRDLGVDPARMGYHAAQGETSMMLATHPDLVDMGKAVEGFMGDASIRWKAKVPPPMDQMSPTGILGDARGATAEIGERLLDFNTRQWVEAVRSGKYAT
jgi:creatinine amidohydrolase